MPGETLPLSAWGFDGAEVAPYGGGTANRNFLVRYEGRRFFLRERSPRYSNPVQILFDHALMRHVAAHGVHGPDPIPTLNGETVARKGEDVYELHPYRTGKVIDWKNLDHLRMAAQSLHRFHRATAQFKPPVSKTFPREDSPHQIHQGLEEFREVIYVGDQRRTLDELERWADRIANALPDTAFWALPCQVIHGDFHPGNVNVGKKSLGMFDFDCASRQPRARDLADAILYFCARRDGPFDSSNIIRMTRECWLEPERNRLFLEAYGPIEPEERAALQWLVAARWIFSRVRGRLKLPKEQWPSYATPGILTPLEQLSVTPLF